MALLWFGFQVRSAGALMPGLTPFFAQLKKLADNSDVSPLPVITAVGNGQYKFQYDADASGEALGMIDAGTSIPAAGDRYICVELYAFRSRIQAGISTTGTVHVGQNDDKSGYLLDPDGLALVEVEPGLPLPQALSYIGAATAGISDGAGTGTVHYYAMAHPTVLRITSSVTPVGDRTSVAFS
jgi:hypothetical protein